MRASVFFDLDGLLVRSYQECEDASLPEGGVRIYNGIYSVLRPGADSFLRSCKEVANLYLFTSAQPSYAKSVTKAFNLHSHFERLFSGTLAGSNSIAAALNLYGKPWILLDDSPWDHDTVKHKLMSLGIQRQDLEDESLIARHFRHVPSFCPHNPGQDFSYSLIEMKEEFIKGLKETRKKTLVF